MAFLIPILAVLLAGVGIAVQAPTNAALGRTSGSFLLAALVSFAIGTVVLLAAWLAVDRTPVGALRGAPGWGWLGGLYGAGFVAAMAFATPRLGLATAVTLAIAAQLLTALVCDHYGLFGLKIAHINGMKIGGAVLMLAGVVLVRRG